MNVKELLPLKMYPFTLYLYSDSTNRDSLDTIERCLFVLSLDKRIPISFNHQRSIDETNMNIRDDVSLLLQMLHGHGSKVNSSNRWFDKTMQVYTQQAYSFGKSLILMHLRI